MRTSGFVLTSLLSFVFSIVAIFSLPVVDQWLRPTTDYLTIVGQILAVMIGGVMLFCICLVISYLIWRPK